MVVKYVILALLLGQIIGIGIFVVWASIPTVDPLTRILLVMGLLYCSYQVSYLILEILPLESEMQRRFLLLAMVLSWLWLAIIGVILIPWAILSLFQWKKAYTEKRSNRTL